MAVMINLITNYQLCRHRQASSNKMQSVGAVRIPAPEESARHLQSIIQNHACRDVDGLELVVVDHLLGVFVGNSAPVQPPTGHDLFIH
jgi:hypothetical protein